MLEADGGQSSGLIYSFHPHPERRGSNVVDRQVDRGHMVCSAELAGLNDCGDLHISKSCYRSTVTSIELIDVIRRDTKSQCRSFSVEVNGAERRTEAPGRSISLKPFGMVSFTIDSLCE
jgi:hypothetical protein